MKLFNTEYNGIKKAGKSLLAITVLASAATAAYADDDDDKTAFQKVDGPISLMVLGSGGPIATAEGRASASYLVFIEGKPRILMDAGGGAFQRLAESGTNIKDLDIVLLSHLHADHTGDLTSIMKTVYFHNNLARAQGQTTEGRELPIRIWGPNETTAMHPKNGVTHFYTPMGAIPVYPSTANYADSHFSIKGSERYLKAFVKGISDDDGPMGPKESVSSFAYERHNLSSDVAAGAIETVLETDDGVVITAIAVDHGPVPSVAYRIEYKSYSIAYSGDTGTKGPGRDNMIAISDQADLLVYDAAIMEMGDMPKNPLFHLLHTQPSLIANVAINANVDTVVLSHLTPVTSRRTNEIEDIIEDAGFEGEVEKAKDLKVFNLEEQDD